MVLLTAIWGSTFPLIKGVVERVPVVDFLALRFVIATLAVVAVAYPSVRRLTRRELGRGAVLGLVYGVAQILQTVGLAHTSAAVSGFITGMYVVATPLIGVFWLGVRPRWNLWVAVVLATAGLAVLSLQGLAVGTGEALTLLSALMYAVHIVLLSQWSRVGSNTWGLTAVQLAVVALVCAAGGFRDGFTLPQTSADWWVLLYVAVLAGAVAMLLQTWAQARMSATRAAITMTMEPVWAGVFAVAIGGEQLGVRILLGGLLVLVAMYLVEARTGEPPRA
ncbi:EamA family transporter [Micromonospora echinofusca]|uniref:EamA family transporter n=2 Tax=Micromonospora echinofusca TaxID=47858 RepID=A0ABS3VZP5_MICEH|nr:EamA family transporter [Micromonospora echinofusca]